jgi:hypothetical protein
VVLSLIGGSRIYVVADNYKIHKTPEVESLLKSHPRIELLWLLVYCRRANPVERVFGDVHDKCTRNHRRQRLQSSHLSGITGPSHLPISTSLSGDLHPT